MSMMRLLLTGCLLTPFLLTGCESMSNTAAGGLVGAGAGAGLGALAGGGKGALIGGLAGTLVGGAVGNSVDQQEKRQAAAAAAAAQAGPALGMSDVIQMSRQGMNDGVIINQIRSTGSTFQLSVEDLRTLQANNVSPAVVMEMQSRPVTRVVYPRRYYYYDYPPPPPPVGIGVVIR